MRLRSFLAKVLLTPLNILPLPLIVVAIAVIGIDTPLALADSFSAVGSIEIPGCSQSATLSEPGSIDVSCGGTSLPNGTIFGTLGWSSGDIHYFMNPNGAFDGIESGSLSGEVNIAGEIVTPGNGGTSTITFEFGGMESQNMAIGCNLIFDGDTTACSFFGANNGEIWTLPLEFVVQNGQSYNFDLELAFEAPLLAGIPMQASFQYSLPGVIPEPVPEPVSLVLLLSGFAPVVFRRSLWRS